MEYEKHINKLVLGYLKTKCKSSYKTFLRSNFPSPTKHLGTRVAGQTLEDILRIYSHVQEIVQTRLEYTDYYKEHDGSSPMYLAEQLLYLLDNRKQLATPATTIRDRSPCGSSLADYGNEEHFSDVETTPEHTLPGNTPTNDPNSQTPFRNPSLEFKTPYSENIPSSSRDFLTSVMSQTLLNKKSFHEKLANNINAASTSKDGNDQLENTVQKALNRTEQDSIFEGLLDELWEPLSNSFGKAITAEAAAITTSIKHSTSQEKFKAVEEHNNRAISSILAVSNTDQPSNQPTNQDASSSTDTPPQVTSTQQTYQVPAVSQVNNQPQMVQTVQANIPMSINSQQMYQGQIYAIPAEQQQQQYIFVNRPLVIPPLQPQVQMMQIIQAPGKRKMNNLSETDIMAMPTIIVNENEMAYADPNRTPVNNTPYKSTEVNNIKDYFNNFGATAQSPIIRSTKPIKPTPTVKVEIFHNRQTVCPTVKNTSSKDLPILGNTTIDDDVILVATDPASTGKSTPQETMVEPVKNDSHSVHTPSPLVAVGAKKPTPKSSSHVRNLTFPSPLKKTCEKDDGGRNLPSALNKQQATKDLFKTIPEEIEKPTTATPRRNKSSPKKTMKTRKPVTRPVTKKTSTATPKTVETKSSLSWDAALRKNLASAAEEANESTPLRRVSTRKRVTRSTELDTTEADGKLIENALKTPTKGKTPRKRTRAETKKDEEKLPEVEEVPQVEEVHEVVEEMPQVEASVEPITILSPSNLCNTATKKNMEFDGITPNNSKDGSHQLVSNARKNISALLETPLKNDETDINIPPTPLTPMLEANLKDYTRNGHFSIHTPNVPITPGSAFNMETTSAPYYTLNDTETNKATEAIVLSEERKSSVRKTDDEDVVVSPNVYSGRGILEGFNKRCIATKNLDLLSRDDVQWEGSSDKEDHSEESLSEETNNTVIPNNRRSSGKSMSMLKSNMLDESNMELDKYEVCMENKLEIKVKAKGVSSSSDSEIISKAEHVNKKQIDDNVDTTKKSANISISTMTAETIKEAPSATTLTSHMTTAYSIKKEIEEKRKRMINLEKAAGTKPPDGRRRRANPKPNLNSPSNKRRRNMPKKLQSVSEDGEENDNKKTDTQDEFFKKSGTNLHRTRSQKKELDRIEEEKNKSRETSECEVKPASKEAPEASTSNTENPELDESVYGYRVMETQSNDFHIKYDPKKSSKKPFEDYNLELLNSKLEFLLPIHDAPDQVVHTTVMPFKFVLEIEPGECGSDLENSEEARSKKRKHRTSSTNSNSSCKKIKTSLMPKSLAAFPSSLGDKDVIEKVLTQLHGPSESSDKIPQ